MNKLLFLTSLTLTACGDGFDPACNKSALESDLSSTGWTSASNTIDGVPAPSGSGSYLISTTYLKMRSGDATKKSFTALVGPIIADAATRDGLVAYQFASSEHCNTARTITVWRDEAAMYTFIGAPAHSAAINAIDAISRGGSQTTHFLGSEKDATWESAASKLAATGGRVY